MTTPVTKLYIYIYSIYVYNIYNSTPFITSRGPSFWVARVTREAAESIWKTSPAVWVVTFEGFSLLLNLIGLLSQMPHGTGIFTCIYHRSKPKCRSIFHGGPLASPLWNQWAWEKAKVGGDLTPGKVTMERPEKAALFEKASHDFSNFSWNCVPC